jgi:hypothetical protein
VLTPITVTPVQTTEGGHLVTVSGSYTDVGTLDTHTVTIDFGDGTVMSSTDPDTTIVINALNRTFTATHEYLDNPNLTTTPSSEYTIKATVTDNYGLSSNSETAQVEVDNVAPIFAGVTLNGTGAASPVNGQIPSTITINEEGVVTIVGSFRDPGILDTQTVSINWNDPGVPSQIVTAVRDATDPTLWHFTASHEYVRDNPGGVYMPVREISMTATDKDGGTTTVNAVITIAHIEPVIDSVTVSPPVILGGDVVVLTGVITDSGLHPVADIQIDWGDGTGLSSFANGTVTYNAATHTFTAVHQYLNDGSGELHFDQIKVALFDDDTGFAFGHTAIEIDVLPNALGTGFLGASIPQTPLGAPVVQAVGPFEFQSTVFTPIDVASGGLRVIRVATAQGSPVELPLNLAELGGGDLSQIQIDWGDGNTQTLNDPGNGSIDVAHNFQHIVGDDEIATGALAPAGADDNGHNEVVVKAFKKGPDGHNELASITRYRVVVEGISPRVDRFSLRRTEGADGDIDTLDGRIDYRGLPDSVTVSIVWSDGTTSNGAIEKRNGEFWFSAVRTSTGKAPPALVSLRFVNTTNSKIIGSFEIKPQSSTMLDPAAPANQAPSNQRHGDAAPAHHANRAITLHTPGGSAVTQSDLALMFGAGALAIAGGVQKRNAKPGVRQTDAFDPERDDGSTTVEPAPLWVDRSLANAIRRQQTVPANPIQMRKPKVAAKPDWLATPYRVPAAVSADGIDGWHEVDDWLLAGNAVAQATDTADWLVVRE